MNFKTIRVLALFAPIFLFSASLASAASSPIVSSFAAAPQSLSYGYSTALSWVIGNGAGASLYFTCPAGVSIKKIDGTIFPCNTKQAASASATDSVGFYINNVTGNSIVLPVKIVPKDVLGVDFDAGAMTINLYVGSVPYPISNFSYATSSTATSTTPITLTWTGVEIGGTNLQFDCKDGIQIYSTSPVLANAQACGRPIYVSDLPASGSASVYFVNNNSYSVDQTVRIFPAISVGVYDATHASTLTFSIPPKPIPGVPSLTSFASSQTLLASGQAINFSWSTSNAQGVNLQMACGNAVTWSGGIGATTTLPCGVPAFTSALPATGSTTISFINGSQSTQSITISAYPQNFDGTYDGTKVRTVNLLVYEPGHIEQAVTTPIPNVPTTSAQAAGSGTSGVGNIKAAHTITFSTNLRVGSRGAQVSALQTFLKQDPSLYPDGLVTGYLGQASITAVKKFQERYGVVKKGDAGYGEVGPKTRAKLNSIQNF